MFYIRKPNRWIYIASIFKKNLNSAFYWLYTLKLHSHLSSEIQLVAHAVRPVDSLLDIYSIQVSHVWTTFTWWVEQAARQLSLVVYLPPTPYAVDLYLFSFFSPPPPAHMTVRPPSFSSVTVSLSLLPPCLWTFSLQQWGVRGGGGAGTPLECRPCTGPTRPENNVKNAGRRTGPACVREDWA
jgi:hypothetical protein